MVGLRFLGGTALPFLDLLRKQGVLRFCPRQLPPKRSGPQSVMALKLGYSSSSWKRAATAASFGHSSAAARSRVGSFLSEGVRAENVSFGRLLGGSDIESSLKV